MTAEQFDEQVTQKARDRFARAYFDLVIVLIAYSIICEICYSYHWQFNYGRGLWWILLIFMGWNNFLPLNHLPVLKVHRRLLGVLISFVILAFLAYAKLFLDMVYVLTKPLRYAQWPIVVVSGIIYLTIGIVIVVRLQRVSAALKHEELEEQRVEAEIYSDEPETPTN